MNDPDLTERLSTADRLLVRSGTEIYRTLETMRANEASVTTHFASGNVFFRSRLLHVDPAQKFIVLECSDHRPANSVLLAARSAVFQCSHGGAHFEFASGDPREVHHGDKLAIQADFPAVMLALHRRSHRRFQVPPELPLRCKIPLEGKVHEADVTDISVGGVGTFIYSADLRIDPGTLIERAVIIHPAGRRVRVDLEVRHVARALLVSGRAANRTGCRLLGAPEDIEDLMGLFVTAVE